MTVFTRSGDSSPAARAVFDAIEKWLNGIGVWLIIALMLSVTVDVVHRTLLGRSIVGVFELDELLMVGICFFVLAYTQRQRGHVRVELVLIRLPEKARYFTELAAWLLTLAVCAILLWQSIVQAQLTISMHLITTGLIQYPLWPARICLSIGFLFLCVRVGIQLIDMLVAGVGRAKI